ncbi:MAG: co-chaperone GroES family protein [Candidatus Marinimicrobia bacterium]|jgi:chaperonin GroES|nr:co-chaperone GroES family protein [Candidatus Neomarinimicrobiota bacterium]MDD4961428.1 co-chaperone GroES family protein [Candidatus Neomarinimicrobiota bacterium]MDD5709394.1 co-chaperone GroES family protein [Candidatus Neomarinimicrobiota bacterium]MDX9777236.1 co-chaperone GroES family protein [bacterium]
MKELQPVSPYVLLDINEESGEQRTAAGIIIPDTAKEKKKTAKVLAVSNVENAEVAVGDTVLYKSFSGDEVEYAGKKYLLIPYADILAKLVETDAI